MKTDASIKLGRYYTRLLASERKVARLEKELAEARQISAGLRGRVDYWADQVRPRVTTE